MKKLTSATLVLATLVLLTSAFTCTKQQPQEATPAVTESAPAAPAESQPAAPTTTEAPAAPTK